MTTEVIDASAMQDLVLRILEAREPGTLKAHAKALAKYERDLARGGHTEIKVETTGSFARYRSFKVGYNVIHRDGTHEFVERPPAKLYQRAYSYSGYRRDAWTARSYGLLTDARYNRDIRPDRVDAYVEEMKAGRWRDLLSDPITITDDGQVLNGQHRIAAATDDDLEWSKIDSDPAFLVVWGVEPHEAQYADGSRRTQRDEKVIADKLVASLSGVAA